MIGDDVAVTVARFAAGVLALVIAAFFGLGIVQAHNLTAAQAVLDSAQNPTPAQTAAARQQLDTAGTLNPDRAVALTRGQLDLRLGQLPAAERVFRALVAAEPKNVEAWLGLSESLYGKPGLVAAVARIAVLDPQDAKQQR